VNHAQHISTTHLYRIVGYFKTENFAEDAESEFRRFLFLKNEYSKSACWISNKSVNSCHLKLIKDTL